MNYIALLLSFANKVQNVVQCFYFGAILGDWCVHLDCSTKEYIMIFLTGLLIIYDFVDEQFFLHIRPCLDETSQEMLMFTGANSQKN